MSADELKYNNKTHVLTGQGNVEILHEDIAVGADKISFNTKSKNFTATGNVIFQRGDFTWRGGSINGNLEDESFTLGQFNADLSPWISTGTNIEIESRQQVTGYDVNISTCEYLRDGKPHWRMQCSKIDYFADGSFKAYDVTHKIAGIPIFYSPVIKGRTNQDFGNFHVSAGYKSDFGLIFLLGRDWEINESSKTQAFVTYRSKRGTAVGNKTKINTANSSTDFLIEGMRDRDPLTDIIVRGKEFNGRFRSENDRFRAKLQHRSNLTQSLGLTANLDLVSDNDLLQEFFKRDFRQNPQPVSFAELTYSAKNANLSLNYRPRFNDFESVVERSPELQLSLPRQPIFDSGFIYKGQMSASRLEMKWRDYDISRIGNLIDPLDYRSERIDSLNVLYRPFRFKFLNFIPRSAIRFTHYTKTSKAEVTDDQLNRNFVIDDPKATIDDLFNAVNYDDRGGSKTRVSAEFGIEVSMKAARVFEHNSVSDLDTSVDRHVVQPFINYSFIPRPNIDRENLFFFDEVDRIDKTHFTRFGVRHLFQRDRNGSRTNLMSMENFFDLYFSPAKNRDRPGDFGTVLKLTPSRSASYWSKFLVDTNSGDINIFNAGGSFSRAEKLKVDFGYLYRHPFTSRYNYSMGSELTQILTAGFMPTNFGANQSFHLNCGFPLNDKTSLNFQYFIDLERESVGRQTYQLTRDLHCWMGAIGIEHEENDFSVFLLFYLKAFPKFKIDIGS